MGVPDPSNSVQATLTEAQRRAPSHPVKKLNLQATNVDILPRKNESGTALQKHVEFFDRDGDGVIYPNETFQAMSALGFNWFICGMTALAFHILHLSYFTQDSWIPNPKLPVYIKNISAAKHGSDTNTYNADGEFVKQNYDRIFEKFDLNKKGGLYFSEIVTMWRANRGVLDPVGLIFQVFLWTYLWAIAADEQGVLHKESVWKQYDGTLFYEVEASRKAGNVLPWYRGGHLW
ncbi:hypothetical protein HK097_001174 [Rhizophlyctis rosea]|uniref:EF-hand domain-containing protein n=1 Tax=Rhizophlyctis rosea TaxID=64517 RepID=A0AAD5S4P5_9FUNG|nr:hypothetical protein HK097_001174 [Rhizophlyctis rosea]